MKNKEFWLVVGSQHLYGPATLKQVEKHAQEMVNWLNKNAQLPFSIKFAKLAVSQDDITNIVKEINYRDEVAGVITWMHTFSPAKMWVRGTKLLQKPLLHLATQYNENIPWNTIDMDFMNLNQAAHGDREYGYINSRLNKKNKIVVGYWKNDVVQKEIAEWMVVANAYNESFNIRIARFGDNMRSVAVTEGDKIQAQIDFGWVVDYYPIGDLVKYINKVSATEVDALYKKYLQEFDYTYDKYDKSIWSKHVKEQARIEIGLRDFLTTNNYSAFTTNFETLDGLKQLPGLAVQRLMLDGYGFAAEGDWKTAGLNRLLKIMSSNKSTGFMEDYTYELKKNNEYILQAHMLEVDPTLANNKPSIKVSPLGIGGKEDPARLVFDGKAGEGVVISMIDCGTKFKLLINEVSTFTPVVPAPKLPVARVLWKVKPNFIDGVKKWIEIGGGHHTVLTLSLTTQQIIDYCNMVNLEYILIK